MSLEKHALQKDKLERHFAIDWIRMIATLAVFVFHSGIAYGAGDWHLNNPEESFSITVWNTWLLIWIMPVFFFLSGASAHFALVTRPTDKFVQDRFQRLAIPLIFGILVIVPPQVYIERLTRLQFTKSFFEFYPRYFEGWYLSIGGQGNFAWMGLHLWYLLLLLILSVAMLPLMKWIKREDKFQAKLIQYANKPSVLFLFAFPIALIEMIWGNVGLGGWNMLTYPFFFLYGYMLFSRLNVREIIKGHTFPSLIGAIGTSVTLLITLFSKGIVGYGQHEWRFQTLLHAFSGWFWVIAILGLAYRYLNFNNNLLKYANEAVLPFYILHQTVIILFGFLINHLDVSIGLKYTLVVFTSFVSILLVYEFLKRVRILRLLFGMKVKPQPYKIHEPIIRP
ncbi:MAG: acyltransferase family protein [Chloroflexi bacterium]|nr:acyltransferase family protein [Chloroflexota bacterium]